jgi:2-polyprenyl-3-methyl-5-hydroxy-6-metoxy-1,4-benzoquinol methylase
MTDYNRLSDLYHFSKDNPVKLHSEEYTFFKILGNVKGKSILDLACGDGYYTRKLKMSGARYVLGVDISEKMIDRAREIEKNQPYDIDYAVYDVCQSSKLGQFDVVTSVYLFPYALTPQKIEQMAKTMNINLRPDGRMISVTISPFISDKCLDAQRQYNVEMKTRQKLTDGTSIQIKIKTSQDDICLENIYWSQKIYEQALTKAGFKSIVWHKPEISQLGIQQYEKNYWNNHIAMPGFAILDCSNQKN